MVAIFVLITFLIIIGINLTVTQLKNKRIEVFKEQSPDYKTGRTLSTKKHLLVPEGFFFSKGHTWLQIERDGTTKFGIDDFLNKITGNFVIETLIGAGKRVKKGDKVFRIKFDGKKFNIPSPVNGTILKINQKAIENPSLISNSPYEEGWLYVIEPTNLKEDLGFLNIGKDVVQWMKNEVQRFKDLIGTLSHQNSLIGATMYDGGSIQEGVVSFLDEESIQVFEKEFLAL